MAEPFVTVTENHMIKLEMPEVFWGESPALFLTGSCGAGKTTLAETYAFAWEGDLYVSAPKLITHIRDNCKERSDVAKFLNAIMKMPRLVLDDVGYESPEPINIHGTKYMPRKIIREIIYNRINARLRTVITSNGDADRLAVLYDETKADTKNKAGEVVGHRGRLYSRLMGFATIYKFTGDLNKAEKVDCVEVQRPKSGAGKDSKVPVFPVDEKEELQKLPDTTEQEAKETMEFLADKPELMDMYCERMKKTEFKNLIPEGWHEEAKNRKRKARAFAKGKSKSGRNESAGIDGAVLNDVIDRIQSGTEEGGESRTSASADVVGGEDSGGESEPVAGTLGAGEAECPDFSE